MHERRRCPSSGVTTSGGCLNVLSAMLLLMETMQNRLIVEAFSINQFDGAIRFQEKRQSTKREVQCSLLKALSGNKDTSLESSSDKSRRGKNMTHFSPKNENTNNSEDYEFWGDTLTVASFNMDLENLSCDDPQKSADFLDIMEAKYREDPTNPFYVKPNSASYTTVIDGWTRFEGENPSSNPSHSSSSQNHHHRVGAQQAHAWLERLERAYDASGDEDLKPNRLSYILVCQKWADDYAQDFDGESIEMAEKVLLKMRERLKNGAESDEDFKVWSIVLDGWCKRAGKVRGAMQRAEKVLSEMEQHFLAQKAMKNVDSTNDHGATDGPNIVTYTNFIGGLARSIEGQGAAKAEEILERMKTFGGIEPDMVAYTALLNCYAKASSRQEQSIAAKRALEILDFMESQYINEEKFYLKPNVITYSTAIKAVGQSLHRDAAKVAESILRRMYSLHETGKIASIKPQTSTYNAVISALANQSRRTMRHRNSNSIPSSAQRIVGLKNARRAEQLLVEMTERTQAGEAGVEPNVRTWASIISAWAESGQGDAGDQAQRVIYTMQELYDRGDSTAKPNFVCFTSALAAMGASAVPSNDPGAIAKNAETADRVDKILMKMEDEYEATLDIDHRPNTITYITAIDSFCKLDEKNAAIRAQRTVDRMVRLYAKGLGYVRPSRIVFNSLINAWSRSPKGPRAAQKAEEIFLWMEKQHRDSGDNIIKPDEVSLCGVLNAWANNAEHGGAPRAQQILDKIEAMSTKERGFQHSTVAYNIAIKAWGRSKEPDAVQRAEAILERLEKHWNRKQDETLKPDVTTYSSVINCCAYYDRSDDMDRAESGGTDAFEVALRTFRKLCESKTARPNNITYGTLLKAIASLTPTEEERESLVRTIFSQCCKEGQVDTFVLSQVRNACSKSLYRELILEPVGKGESDCNENFNFLLKQLPEEWRRKTT